MSPIFQWNEFLISNDPDHLKRQSKISVYKHYSYGGGGNFHVYT
jgi:hypothetical protein